MEFWIVSSLAYLDLENCSERTLVEGVDDSDGPGRSEDGSEVGVEVGVDLEVTPSPVAEWASSGAD